MFLIKCLIFLLGLKAVATQFCDSSIDATQCEDGEICKNNVCETALYCGGDSNLCLTTPGLICRSDYCQPDRCTSTGQCVHGQVCSQDTARQCVYPIVYNIEEGSEFTLIFKEPATPGSYEEIHWYKGGRDSLNRLAVIHPIITDNKVQYYNDLCPGHSPCRESGRAHLNRDTGELTIHSVQLSDAGFYYYEFSDNDNFPDTGIYYEYKLNVYDCDSSRDVTQCSDGEICRNNRCEDASYCGGDSNLCLITPGQSCVSDYCQPDPCTSTGQCVHGQVCSQYTNRRCVYPVVTNVKKGSEVKIQFQEPATTGSYEEIQWFKGGRRSLDRVAVIHPILADNKTQYYIDFCSDKSLCSESERAHLNTDTGELTIFKVALADEGFYYYSFYSVDGLPDTGVKYEYKLNVYVLSTLTIEGVPSEQVEVGTDINITCTVDRIRPLALAMFWVVHGRNKRRSLSNTGPDLDGISTQTTTYKHAVTREDNSAPIRCVAVPVYGDLVEVEAFINPGYRSKNGGLIAGCVIGALVLVGLVVAAVFVCKKYRFNIQIESRNVSAAGKGNQQENPVNNNAEPANRPNEYQYIDVRAMDGPRDAGFVNPALTTYEDIM